MRLMWTVQLFIIDNAAADVAVTSAAAVVVVHSLPPMK